MDDVSTTSGDICRHRDIARPLHWLTPAPSPTGRTKAQPRPPTSPTTEPAPRWRRNLAAERPPACTPAPLQIGPLPLGTGRKIRSVPTIGPRATTCNSNPARSISKTSKSVGIKLRSSTGPTGFKLQYGTDGTTFTDNLNYTVLNNEAANGGTWNSTTFISNYHFDVDLSSITALENQAAVYFRLTNTVTGTNIAGASRVDNFTITGIVPEPATGLLMGVSILVSLALARRPRPVR